MRLDLSRLDTRALELMLSDETAAKGEQQYVRIISTQDVQGVLDQSYVGLHLDAVRAARALLDSLRLVFGSVALEAGGKTDMSGIAAEYRQQGDTLTLEFALDQLITPRLQVEVGNVLVAANTRLDHAKLSVRGGQGEIRAPSGSFGGLLVNLGSVTLAAPKLTAKDICISWGDGFKLTAREVRADNLQFETTGTRFGAEDVRVRRLTVHDSDWSLDGLTADKTQVEMNLARTPTEIPVDAVSTEVEPEDPDEHKPTKPIFDWHLLDQISGQLDVDLDVDVKLPVIRSRHAVHQFRIPLQRGTLNYRKLEDNLATLEDTLFDFAVRDDELVLELGAPLLPTRGFGKPLVRWPLNQAEVALAHEHRVRLVTLAHPKSRGTNGPSSSTRPSRQPSSAPPPSSAAPSSSNGSGRLRQLAFRNINADLKLDAADEPLDALVRALSIDRVALRGAVVYKSSAGDEHTQLDASLRGISLDLDDFPLTGRQFDLDRLQITSVPWLRLDFTNAEPTRLELQLAGLDAKGVHFGAFAEGEFGAHSQDR